MEYVFLGNRASDGLVLATCFDNIRKIYAVEQCKKPSDCRVEIKYASSGIEPRLKRTTSDDIDVIVNQYLAELSSVSVAILPYDIPSALLFSKHSDKVINWQVISRKLPRAIQRRLCKNCGVKVPKWKVVDCETSWDSVTEELGSHVVVQLDHTSNSNGTFFVESRAVFEALKQGKRGFAAIVSEFVMGVSACLHIYIEPGGEVQVGAPSLQVFSEEMREDQGKSYRRYVGNDFGAFNALPELSKERVHHIGQQLGRGLYEHSYFGLVGVDVLIDSKYVLVVEINFRMQNSTSLMTLLEIQNRNSSLIGRLLGADHKGTIAKGSAISGAQILCSGPPPRNVPRLLEFSKENLEALRQQTDPIGVVFRRPEALGGGITRIFTNQSICDGNGLLLEEYR